MLQGLSRFSIISNYVNFFHCKRAPVVEASSVIMLTSQKFTKIIDNSQNRPQKHVIHHLIMNLEHKGIIKTVSIYKDSEHIEKDSRGADNDA